MIFLFEHTDISLVYTDVSMLQNKINKWQLWVYVDVLHNEKVNDIAECWIYVDVFLELTYQIRSGKY